MTARDKPKPAADAGANERASAREGETKRGGGKLRWILGWVVVPGLLLGSIFAAGLHVGAHYPEMWLSRFFVWLFG